ncbi:ABC transporter ATP-binding protein [Arhodomonas sp. AD133]|uniref:ABC transporter ATP-binding protein n=1 Tax=Arhodomonas sp. AD133 TaxID=3415009 RepID=UPI003EC02F98
MAELPLLAVDDLHLHYRTRRGTVRAVDGVNLTVDRGEALVVLGESGCGKSSLARALMRVLPRNVAELTGHVALAGTDVLAFDEERFRREVRWQRMGLVMQTAMNALNPVVRVGEQVAEPMRVHLGATRARAAERAREVFELVGVSADFLARYPFELSGGMRQRVVLAMALITEPDLVILDEPTSALDVLTQASIMNRLKRIKRELGTSFILITHDVATSSELADRVALMYAGQIVELGSAYAFFRDPAHPYARLLMASVPRLRQAERPVAIAGEPPSLAAPPAGCRFADRCPHRFRRCAEDPPGFRVAGRESVRCWLYAGEPRA